MPARKAPGAPLTNPAYRGDGPPITSSIDVGGVRCRLACVDDVLPRHQLSRGGARPRLVYVNNEVVHFELEGHRYVLIAEEQTRASASVTENQAESSEDMRRLLTSRELQIVQLVSMGYLSKQIADRLQISEFTVRSYLKTIYCKLGVRSRGAMVYRYAQGYERGSPESS